MSKSYNNSIYISDTPEDIRKSIMGFMTDPARKLKTDPGDPDICPLHQIHKLIANEEEIAYWDGACRSAECGCVAHKKKVADDLIEYLAPFQARRAELAAIPGFAREVLEAGKRKAFDLGFETVATCRELIGLDAATNLSEGVSHDKVSLDESAPSFLTED